MPEAPPHGRWMIDPGCSRVGFTVARRGMAELTARFRSVSGHVDIGDPPAAVSLELVVATATIESGSVACDDHLRSAEHLDVARHSTATLHATSHDWTGGRARLLGRLTLVGVTNEVELDLDYVGPVAGPPGAERSVFAGAGSIDRDAWGLTWNVTLAGGQPLVRRVVDLEVELEAVRQPCSLTGPSAPAPP